MFERPAGQFNTTYAQETDPLQKPSDRWAVLLAALCLIGLPALGLIPANTLSLMASIGATAIAVMGLNILLGYTGQISLGQAAFVMVGAYTSTLLAREWGWTFWLSLPVAGLVAGLVGLLFGLPALRVKGFYLAMATLAAQFIIPWMIKDVEKMGNFLNWLTFNLLHLEWSNSVTGGATGLQVPPPSLFGMPLTSARAEYYTVLAVVALLYFFMRNLIHTRTGRAFIAIRDNEAAAEVLGVDLYRYKLKAFFLCALYAGISGALQAHFRRSVSPDGFTLVASIELLAMLVVGGAGFLSGPLFGVSLFRLLQTVIVMITPAMRQIIPSVLPFVSTIAVDASFRPIVFGLALMAFLIYQPLGLAYWWRQLSLSWRLRPFSR